MTKKGNIKAAYRHTLYARSRGLCNICKQELIKDDSDGEPTTIAEVAHICGEKPRSARFVKDMTIKERNSYQNLILLCSNCHTLIDKNEKDYGIDYLKEVKQKHEIKTTHEIRAEIQNINFDELEVVLKFLSSHTTPTNDEGEIILTHPKKKIDRNNLSPDVDTLIAQGMAKVELVSSYLNENPDINFSSRLQSEFIKKYEDLKMYDTNSNEIFYALLEFAKGKNNEPINYASGLTVLTYFFEKCDVFEK